MRSPCRHGFPPGLARNRALKEQPPSDQVAERAASDHDVFSIVLAKGQAYDFNVQSDLTLGGLTAPGLDVLGPNGKVLASDHGPNPDALVHFTAPDAGTYFLDVSGDGGLTGHYILIA